MISVWWVVAILLIIVVLHATLGDRFTRRIRAGAVLGALIVFLLLAFIPVGVVKW